MEDDAPDLSVAPWPEKFGMTKKEILREMILQDMQADLLRQADDPCVLPDIEAMKPRRMELSRIYWDGVEHMSGAQITELIRALERGIRRLRGMRYRNVRDIG